MSNSLEERANIARQVYKDSLNYFESFKGEVGVQMTYLLGSILEDSQIELDCSMEQHRKIMEHFHKCFPSNHPVWNYIHLEF